MTAAIEAIQALLGFLDRYANLLLVLITAAYAWLTWRTLRALQQASLREREARHLQEIKDNVLQPILSWTSGTVVQRFIGKTPALLSVWGGYDGKPLQLCYTVDDPFVAMRQLSISDNPSVPDPLTGWTSLRNGRVSEFLYEHAKSAHFQEELQGFDQFLEDVRRLCSAFVLFANRLAVELGQGASIAQQQPDTSMLVSEEALSGHQLVAECVLSLLQNGQVPRVRVAEMSSNPKLYAAYLTENKSVARGALPDELKKSCETALAEVHRRWETSELPGKVSQVLEDAERVRRNIEKLLFTHSLGVNCALVSGEERRH